MTDKEHELNAIKFVQETTLSSKVDKFNKKLAEEKEKQSTNPFNSTYNSRNPKELKPEEYGRPKAGTLTELRGKKANVHVYREMIELCQIIHDDGKPSKENPEQRFILFGELFDIYVNISNKVVGLLLRARKYGLLTFEGECLFQKFHDHVPIYLLHSMKEIKEILTDKQDEVGLDKSKSKIKK